MSGPPGHKTFSTAEMSFLSSQAAQRAEARTVNLEARLAQTEARLAEQDRLISELASGFRQANDTISALSVVVKELQEAGFKGVDQVLTGLEARVSGLEQHSHEPQIVPDEDMIRVIAAEITHAIIKEKGLRPPQKRGPKPKNKPELPPVVEQQTAEMNKNAPIQQPEGE